MKIELQKLIDHFKEQEQKAISNADACYNDNNNKIGLCYEERAGAFCYVIHRLTLLLDSGNEKSSQSSQGDGSNSSNAM